LYSANSTSSHSPLVNSSGVTSPTVSATSIPAISSVTPSSVSRTDRTVVSVRSTSPRRSSWSRGVRAGGLGSAVGDRFECVHLGVVAGRRVGVGGYLPAVDLSVPLPGVVRQRDVDGVALQAGGADGFAHRHRALVGARVDGRSVEVLLGEALVDVPVALLGQFD